MKPNTLFFVEFLFFDVVALAWGAWELWSVRKDKRETPEVPAPITTPSPEPPGHPEG
jgi:hypothetical protein